MAQIIPLNSIFERWPAKNKKFREPVVIVHHYGGNKHSFSRQILWLNDLGFDVITFDLPFRNLSQLTKLPINREWQVGLRFNWSDKIEEVLGSIAENKFVFSFSYPSVSVLMALARRHAIDVKGWITEGGPFAHLRLGIEKLLEAQNLQTVLEEDGQNTKPYRKWLEWSVEKIPLARRALVESTAFAFGLVNYDRDVAAALKMLPTGFSILSLRGLKDELVQPYMIDDFFGAATDRLNIQKTLLNHSGHLTGFREDTATYQQTVSAFLIERATRI